jgi:4,5-DOPA dioxygenase extradiol
MDARTYPSLYLSHGSPMIAITRSPASDFLDRLGPVIDATFGRPRAVVVVSPHSATRSPYVLAATRHEAIHDFGGFPPELYTQRYDAPGAPQLAADVAARLNQAGLTTQVAPQGGLDHGIWTLLKRMWPAADLPVVPLTLVPNWTPTRQWAVGQALAPLAADGVLIIGSGSTTHNLQRFFTERDVSQVQFNLPVEPDVAAFQNWIADKIATRDWAALQDYRKQAPGAARQHPTDEHWLPFYIAAGAGGEALPGQRIHASVDAGLLAMDGYAFGAGAETLKAALA